MSTRAVMMNSLTQIATQRDTAINAIRGSVGGDAGGAGAQSVGILSRIQNLRNQFLAPTGQQAGGQQGGILGGGGILSQGGILGRFMQPQQNGQPQQGLLGRLQQIRTQLTNPQNTGAPTNSFLNAPPQVGATTTPTPMGEIPTDTNVQRLTQKGVAPTSLGQIEVD